MSFAILSLDLHATYEEMAAKKNRRPYRMADFDYFKGNDLLADKDIYHPKN